MITTLFHWSPAERYASVRRHGLLPDQRATVASSSLHYICASPDPQRAWLLSGAADWCQEIEQWDLWMLTVVDTDELHVRPFFGRWVEEIKLRNPIPPERLWWCGRRDIACIPAELLPKGEM